MRGGSRSGSTMRCWVGCVARSSKVGAVRIGGSHSIDRGEGAPYRAANVPSASGERGQEWGLSDDEEGAHDEAERGHHHGDGDIEREVLRGAEEAERGRERNDGVRGQEPGDEADQKAD